MEGVAVGILMKVASIFGKRSGNGSSRRAESAGVSAARRGEGDSNGEDSPLVEVRHVGIGGPRSGGDAESGSLQRRSRQDLLDDLEKSYREVVELVRKVDTHLDRADQRADRMADIADRLLNVVENLPNSEHGEQRHQQQVELLSRLVEAQRSGVEQLDTSLARIGVQAEVAGQSHEQLVMTMAEFRETMCDVARTSGRSAQAIEAANEQKRAADERLASAIAGNQRWMMGILTVSMVLGAGALVLAIIAVVRLGG